MLAVHQCASNEGEHFLELTVPSEDDTMVVRFNFGNRAAVVAKLCAALTLPGVMTPAGLAVSSSGSSSSSSSSSSASQTPAEEEEEDDDDEDDDERKTKVLGKGPAKPHQASPGDEDDDEDEEDEDNKGKGTDKGLAKLQQASQASRASRAASQENQSNQSGLLLCKCGASDHSRTNFRGCPLNKKSKQSDAGASKPKRRKDSKGGDGGGGGAPGTMNMVIKPEPDEYDLVWEKDAVRSLLDGCEERYVKDLVSAFKTQLTFVTKTDNSRVDAFQVLSRSLVNLLVQHASAAAAAAKVPAVTSSDMLTWIAMHIFSEPISHPLDTCFRSLQAELKYQGTHVTLLTVERYKEVLGLLKASDPAHDANTGTTWGGVVDDVEKFRDFEKQVFQVMRTIAVNRNSCVTLDDELVGALGKTVQSKAFSDRKAAREGVKNDATACATTRLLLTVAHKVRRKRDDHQHYLLGGRHRCS